MLNLLLLLQFIKYGILCFGGGYMIIPMLFHDYVELTHIFTPYEFGNLLAISQMTPGAVSVNTATYVGYIKNGVLGAIICSLGLALPTFVLASFSLNIIHRYKESWGINGFFKGAKYAALVMMGYAILLFANISIFSHPISFDVSFYTLKDLFNYPELYICILTIILYRYRFPMMALLILSAYIGLGISYLGM